MKLIKINTDHYIIVGDSEIKIGCIVAEKLVNGSHEMFTIHTLNDINSSCQNVITHSTQLLNTKFNDWFDAQIITLQEVKELLGEGVDVEKKAHNWFMTEKFMSSHIADMKSFIAGYNQALEDNKEKKYTKEDIKQAMVDVIVFDAIKNSDDITHYIQSI